MKYSFYLIDRKRVEKTIMLSISPVRGAQRRSKLESPNAETEVETIFKVFIEELHFKDYVIGSFSHKRSC